MQYTSGYRPTNFWIDATGDMEYIAASHPTYPPTYRVGVGLYRFDGLTLTFQWWTEGVDRYEVTEVRISENKDYVAFGTSSGTWMKMLNLSDGVVLWAHETPGKEQFACDGDDNLNYVIGGTQDWASPYPWFILRNDGEDGYEEVANGTMSGRVNDLDSTPDARYLAFGSDDGEVLMLERTGDTVETVFELNALPLIDAIEIGTCSLLVGGQGFIHIYDLCPPELTIPEDVTVEQETPDGTAVDLEATATDNCDDDVEITSNELPIYPLGDTTVTFTATDDSGNSVSKSMTVHVIDTTPPEITVSDEPIVLWPPNHKYHTIEIAECCVISVTDICDADVDIDDVVITSVSSDEPENVQGNGDGNTVDDIIIVDSQTVELRAERQGDGNGRVYTINFEVTDDSGNTGIGSCTVWVPHDQGSGATAVDDGPGAGYTVYYP